MDVSIRLGHDFGAFPGDAALAGIGLLCYGAGAPDQYRVYASGIHDLSSLCVFGQHQYPDFELPATRRKYY